ncbi:lipopolysaccharide biosynthesis protein [Ferruginibacter albus]|uniref:lipopolysaccharide biosynthesis protein n=1 Tax=Ferruginibacter albus TaxID=2875540 RepID=UPI001CC7854F|nr:oligosaccharide flippase family protein [Ferruginibacter albus]UAY52231.1 hypothetical protein K9M53_00720 [Ferruginibacter albus]
MPLFSSLQNIRKSIVVRSIGIFTFTNFFSKGISFLLIPIFTNPRFLTPADNGFLSIFSSTLIFLVPAITLGMTQSAIADFHKKPKEEFAKGFTTSFAIAAIMTLVLIAVLFLAKDFLNTKYGFPSSFIYLMPALAFLTFSGEQFIVLLRNKNDVKLFAAAGLSETFIEYTLSVILIVVFFYGWIGRVWGIAISLIAVNIFAIIYYVKNKYLLLDISKSQIWEEVKFGIPVLLFQLCVSAINFSDKLLLGAFFVAKKADIGIYSIAFLMGSVVGTMVQSILLYFQPSLYRQLKNDNYTLAIKKDFYRYLKILTLATVIIIVGGFFVYQFLINKIYLTGITYFFIIALSSYIWGISYYFFMFLLFHKQKRKILAQSLISLTTTVLINIVLIKKYFIMGAAWGNLVNTLIFSLLTILFTKNTIKEIFANR